MAICLAVYQSHPAPISPRSPAICPQCSGGLRAELVIALNGIDPVAAGVPPGKRTLRFPVNRGVPVAWNAAVRASRAPVICVINDDVSLGQMHCGYSTMRSSANRTRVSSALGTRWDVASARHRAYLDTTNARRGQL